MPNNGLLSINGNVIDSTPPNEIADIVNDAVSKAVTDLDSTLVHKAGDGTTPEEITGIKDFSYGHDYQQDDNNPSIRAARLRITGQVSPTASQKTVSQVDFYIGNESIAYMGCTRQNGATFIKIASNNDSVPLIFGYKPFQDNTACIRFEKGHPVWRGGQTGKYSEDKALAVVGDIDKKIDDRFALNPPTANRVLVSDGNGKISPSNITVTQLNNSHLGAGQVHDIDLTTISTTYFNTSSVLKWCILNGVCYITAYFVMKTTCSGYYIPSSSLPLPLPKLGFFASQLAEKGTTRGLVYITSDGNNAKIGLWLNIVDGNYFSCSYPVADNWVES